MVGCYLPGNLNLIEETVMAVTEAVQTKKSLKVELRDLEPADKKTNEALDKLYPGGTPRVSGASLTWTREGECWHRGIDVKF